MCPFRWSIHNVHFAFMQHFFQKRSDDSYLKCLNGNEGINSEYYLVKHADTNTCNAMQMPEFSQASLNDIWKASLLLCDSITTNHQVWWQICELKFHCTVLIIPFDFSSKKCIYPWKSTKSSLNFCRHSVELNLFIHTHFCCIKSLCRCADSGCSIIVALILLY